VVERRGCTKIKAQDTFINRESTTRNCDGAYRTIMALRYDWMTP